MCRGAYLIRSSHLRKSTARHSINAALTPTAQFFLISTPFALLTHRFDHSLSRQAKATSTQSGAMFFANRQQLHSLFP